MRYLVGLSNRGSKPSDHDELRSRVKSLITHLGAQLIEVRISDLRIEVDVRTDRIAEVLERLEEVGEVLYHVAVGLAEGEGDPFERALELFNDQRYWEAHESLEALWRRSKENERTLLNGLILIAAAHVKLQVGDEAGYFRVLARALEKLEASNMREYRGLDIESIAEKLRGTLAERSATLGSIKLILEKSPRKTY
ncbi:MAG: DUF309 domain-containing protein [Thaumarchaeota archaeon]|nr:DUF309 domain-containing protein [Candidatus Calditenuaceae archaeon]MDW8186488.1 DUF309 domain-containing protein [Nitrososphaerota archaeon]